MQFKKALMVNTDIAVRAVANKEQVFVYSTFLKPGKHCVMVRSYDPFHPSEHTSTLQTFLVGVRPQRVPFIRKPGTWRDLTRYFNFEGSVFAKWKRDTKGRLRKFLTKHDFRKWKIDKFIKDENELKEIKKYFRLNIASFKTVFHNLMGFSDSFPGINRMHFGEFCETCNLMDDQNFNNATADRIFG